MVGDDVESDVGGAKAGYARRPCSDRQVRGEDARLAEPQPDGVVESIAGVPAYLREQS